MPVSQDAVVWAYRLILGRDPENEQVVQEKMGLASIAELRTAFLQSNEALHRSSNPADGKHHPTDLVPLRPMGPVQVLMTSAQHAALWEHVQVSWEQLGHNVPHHSVLTAADYLPENFQDNAASFWDSGSNDIAMIRDMCATAGVSLEDKRVCLEYGCGVGRVSTKLAGLFERVLAVDISVPHLELARRRALEVAVANIDFVRATRAVLEDLPPFDFLFSRIVLQHNPPPLMAIILQNLLARLLPGGAAVFQIPVFMEGYSFELDSYLTAANPGMEMHCLPQRDLFQIVREAGANILDVRENGDIGNYGRWVSNIILVAKDR